MELDSIETHGNQGKMGHKTKYQIWDPSSHHLNTKPCFYKAQNKQFKRAIPISVFSTRNQFLNPFSLLKHISHFL